MESRVRNHSGVGHGQRTGGAALRGRLASTCIWPDSLSAPALFHDKAKRCRHFNRNITFSTDHKSLNCVEFSLWRSMLDKTIHIFWQNWHFSSLLFFFWMAPNLISTAYFINPSHQSVCLYVYPPIVSRQRLGKHVPAATNTSNNEGINIISQHPVARSWILYSGSSSLVQRVVTIKVYKV
jgi:hypothetical protein